MELPFCPGTHNDPAERLVRSRKANQQGGGQLLEPRAVGILEFFLSTESCIGLLLPKRLSDPRHLSGNFFLLKQVSIAVADRRADDKFRTIAAACNQSHKAVACVQTFHQVV